MLPTSQSEALSAGVKKYFTGVACARGHLAKRDARDGYCNECKRIANTKWAKDNRGPGGKASAAQRRGRAFLNALKVAPCADCRNSFPPECMDFDHVSGKKRMNVGEMAGCSKVRIAAEVAKCDLVCANCHRIRTRKRRSC